MYLKYLVEWHFFCSWLVRWNWSRMGSLTWEFVWRAQHPPTRLKVWPRQLPILLTSLVWATNSPPMNRTSNTVVILISTIRWLPSKMILREIGFFDTQNETMVLAAEMMLRFSPWFLSPLLYHSALRPMALTLSASFESKQISRVHEYQRQKRNSNVSSSDLGSIIILLDLCCIWESRWRQMIQVGLAQSSNRTSADFWRDFIITSTLYFLVCWMKNLPVFFAYSIVFLKMPSSSSFLALLFVACQLKRVAL